MQVELSFGNFEVRAGGGLTPELETIRKSTVKGNVARSRWVVIILVSEMTGGTDCPWTGS